MRDALRRQLDCFATVLAGHPSRLASVLAAFIVSLWLLVPVHELLHVAGCLLTGGEVTRLELHPVFGGAILQQLLPWVVSGGENAGRLAGFAPAGDASYLATVLLPYIVLAPLGAAAARWAARRGQAAGFGAALAAAGQPLAGLVGDFYEAGSIPVTALARSAGAEWALVLRGDDLALVAGLAMPHGLAAWLLVAGGLLVGVVLAASVLWASGGIAPRESRDGQ